MQIETLLVNYERKLDSPDELSVAEIEKYVLGKINKHAVSHSYQRMIVASIDKFYQLMLGIELDLKHLYPSRKTHTLPKYLSVDEVKRMIDSATNQKHRFIIKLLYGYGLRLSELLNLKITDIDSGNMVVHIRKSKRNKDLVVMLSNQLL